MTIETTARSLLAAAHAASADDLASDNAVLTYDQPGPALLELLVHLATSCPGIVCMYQPAAGRPERASIALQLANARVSFIAIAVGTVPTGPYRSLAELAASREVQRLARVAVLAEAHAATPTGPYAVDDRVEVLNPDADDEGGGRVTQVLVDGRYLVRWDDQGVGSSTGNVHGRLLCREGMRAAAGGEPYTAPADTVVVDPEVAADLAAGITPKGDEAEAAADAQRDLDLEAGGPHGSW